MPAGRPPWEPSEKDREAVRLMTAVGVPQVAICRHLGVSDKTLYRHCRHELDCGAAEANTMVGQSMYQMAIRGPYAVRYQAAAFWLKCRAGWKETSTIEIIKPVSEMSAEEIAARLAIERDAQGRDGLGNVVRLRRPAR